jgi:hypothetical protein
MKWCKIPLGTKRTINVFLFLPRTIDRCTRWLERVSIEQERAEYLTPEIAGECWKDIAFVN